MGYTYIIYNGDTGSDVPVVNYTYVPFTPTSQVSFTVSGLTNGTNYLISITVTNTANTNGYTSDSTSLDFMPSYTPSAPYIVPYSG